MVDSEICVRSLQGRDIDALLRLWNRSILSDPISRERFEARILLDPNVDREVLLTAFFGDEMAGFAVAVMPKFALPRDKVNPIVA